MRRVLAFVKEYYEAFIQITFRAVPILIIVFYCVGKIITGASLNYTTKNDTISMSNDASWNGGFEIMDWVLIGTLVVLIAGVVLDIIKSFKDKKFLSRDHKDLEREHTSLEKGHASLEKGHEGIIANQKDMEARLTRSDDEIKHIVTGTSKSLDYISTSIRKSEERRKEIESSQSTEMRDISDHVKAIRLLDEGYKREHFELQGAMKKIGELTERVSALEQENTELKTQLHPKRRHSMDEPEFDILM